MQQILLKALLGHMENKKVVGGNQHNITKGKSCLTALLPFYDGVTSLVDKRGTTGIIFLDLCHSIPHDSLVSKLEGHGFDGWIRNWIDVCTQRVAINVQMETCDE